MVHGENVMIDRHRYTIKQIVKQYDHGRKQFDRTVSLWVYYVTRPISFPITWAIIRTGISANGATVLSMVVGLLSCAMFIIGSYKAMFLGAVFYNGFIIMDSVDGNIARMLHTASPKGEYLDAIVGDMIGMLVVPCIAIGLVFQEGSIPEAIAILLPLEAGYAVLIIAVISTACYQNTVLLFQRRKVIMPIRKISTPANIAGSSSDDISNLQKAMRNMTGFSFLAPASLLFALMNSMWILLVYVALSNLSLFIASLINGFQICLSRESPLNEDK